MAEITPQIPAALVVRFVQAFDDFLGCLKEAIEIASGKAAGVDSQAVEAWKARALPVLERYGNEIHAASEAFGRGDPAPILKQADIQGGLAKNLDGYPLDFAGPEYEKKLDDLETLVVVVSYQVCQAAGLP